MFESRILLGLIQSQETTMTPSLLPAPHRKQPGADLPAGRGESLWNPRAAQATGWLVIGPGPPGSAGGEGGWD